MSAALAQVSDAVGKARRLMPDREEDGRLQRAAASLATWRNAF